MNADRYEPVNVLSAFRGFSTPELKHPITPYRFIRKSGEVHHISQILVFNKMRSGGRDQFHYDVRTKDDTYCRLLFDTHTFTWRLVGVKE